MNVDDIEKNLNNYEVNPDRAIAILLQRVANIEASVRSLTDMQITIMKLIDPLVDGSLMAKQIKERTNVYLAQIQAEISELF